MKKLLCVILTLSLLLCGCGNGGQEQTTAPSEAPTEAPTEEIVEVVTEAVTEAPAEVVETEAPTVYTNPLTGEVLEAPMETRIFAVTINNVSYAMPMYGVSQADLFFEMYINGYATRGLAFFSDITKAEVVGSVRSLRYNFTDLCQIYDAVPVFASGSKKVLADFKASGLQGLNTVKPGNYAYQDASRLSAGYASEHCLFIKGPECLEAAKKNDIRVTPKEDWNYGLSFTEQPLTDGENASVVTIGLTHDNVVKKTVMKYDAEVGRYLFNQFGKDMVDGHLQENIYFDNVIVMLCKVYNEGVYHIAELTGSGEGYFAWGGKIVPIKWYRENETDPITFTYADGTPLELGMGSSYIALAPLTSSVEWE